MNPDLGSFFALPILSVLLFCVCSLQFLRAMRSPVAAPASTRYNRRALRFEKGYKVFAWGVMMAAFLVGLVISFIEVYIRL